VCESWPALATTPSSAAPAASDRPIHWLATFVSRTEARERRQHRSRRGEGRRPRHGPPHASSVTEDCLPEEPQLTRTPAGRPPSRDRRQDLSAGETEFLARRCRHCRAECVYDEGDEENPSSPPRRQPASFLSSQQSGDPSGWRSAVRDRTADAMPAGVRPRTSRRPERPGLDHPLHSSSVAAGRLTVDRSRDELWEPTSRPSQVRASHRSPGPGQIGSALLSGVLGP
jgi:hypothetical protein